MNLEIYILACLDAAMTLSPCGYAGSLKVRYTQQEGDVCMLFDKVAFTIGEVTSQTKLQLKQS